MISCFLSLVQMKYPFFLQGHEQSDRRPCCWLAMCLEKSRDLRAEDTLLPALRPPPPPPPLVHGVFQYTSPMSPHCPKSGVTKVNEQTFLMNKERITDLVCWPGHKAISAYTACSSLLKESTALLPSWRLVLRGQCFIDTRKEEMEKEFNGLWTSMCFHTGRIRRLG